MRKIFMYSVLTVVIALATPSFGQELQELLHQRLQIEGDFATVFKGNSGFNVNINYTIISKHYTGARS